MTNKEKLGTEPAFACVTGVEPNTHLQEGMSKRFYAACAAMQGMLSNPAFHHEKTMIATLSFEYADELLKQEGANS